MNDADLMNKIRRELHAAIAMHAIIVRQPPGAFIPSEQVAAKAFEIADAMVEKGGPIE